MLGLSFASVPLYGLFCRLTGFGGTVQEGAALPKEILAEQIKIRFNTDVAPGLPWSFRADSQATDVRVGEVRKVLYHAKNEGKGTYIGVAIYNVQPARAGLYFHKVQCFCFENLPLKGGETAELPVQFFIDPEIAKDPQMKDVKTITLSYTFFSSKSDTLAKARRRFDDEQTRLIEDAKSAP